MNNLMLVEPRREYQKSFENYILAYERKNDTHYLNIYKRGLEDFHGYLNVLKNLSKGIELPQGWVRTSTFWLSKLLGTIFDEEENEYLYRYSITVVSN